jgi:MFS family permease
VSINSDIVAETTAARAPIDLNASSKGGAAYKLWILFILLTANILNYADRSILSVLANDIKRDLGVTDAQLGFLYGTSFAVFNAVVCFAMARLADVWLRNRLLSLGVAIWSALTLASGLVKNYAQLAAARFGIGLGEATISPISISLLADTFPQRARSLVYGVYMAGPFMGSAICLTVGGWIVANWTGHCGGLDLCQLKGWQAAFIAFGAPGILVAFLVALIREPGGPADVDRRKRSKPIAEAMREMSRMVPPFSFIQFARMGGKGALLINSGVFVAIALPCAILAVKTGDYAQWIGAGIALYALVSWNHALIYTDRPMAHLVVKSRTFIATIVAGAMLSTISASVAFWSVPLAMRQFNVSAFEAGALLAPAMAGGGILGTIVGGMIADWWKVSNRAAPLWINVIAVLGSAAFLAVMLTASSLQIFAAALAVLTLFSYSWPASNSALGQDLIVPTMRGRTSASMSNTCLVVSMCLGPYTVGKIADITGSVGAGLAALFYASPVAVALCLYAIRHLPEAYAKRDRAAAAL